MNVTYIHHSGFLVETDRAYYLFDYEKGSLPEMDISKEIYVLSSHCHGDHYNPEIFPMLSALGMEKIRPILSDDIPIPDNMDALQVSPGQTYPLGERNRLTTFRSTDLGVAFLIEDDNVLIYHAGDLNDWVWEEETDDYNRQMTQDYRSQIRLLAEILHSREIHVAFVVLDPRQEKDYDRGLCHFLETVPAKHVYPMHYWDDPTVIDTFLQDHPAYKTQIRKTESYKHR